MRLTPFILWCAVLLVWSFASGALVAQQATVGTPLHSVSESFAERIGTQWGLNFRNGFIRFGGPGAAMPPFGNFDPNSGLNFGFGFRGGDVNGFSSGSFGQSFQRSLVSQTPVLTLSNGVPGYIGDASISPFVMGYVPVVGNLVGERPAPAATAPAKAPADVAVEKLAAARASSAGRPAPSVAEARRLRAAETESARKEADRFWQKGLAAEKEGSLASARIYYRMAAKRAAGEFQRQILSRLEAIKGPSAQPK